MTTRAWRTVTEFRAPSEPGGERDVIRRMTDAIATLPVTRDELDRLSTAVAETVMNAMEHGNHNDPRLEVDLTVNTDGSTIEVLVSDNGGLRELPDHPEVPDLEAKLEGLQRPRGWGLFLIRNMVDSMDVVGDPHDPSRHTARLRLNLSDGAPAEAAPSPHQQEAHHAPHL